MLNSTSENFPQGIANSSDVLGRYLMDHLGGIWADGRFSGHSDKYYSGRRPTGCYVPRFRNVTDKDERFLRGFGYQGNAYRPSWHRGASTEGIGKSLKEELRRPGPWHFAVDGFGEMLPDRRNRAWLDEKKKDSWSIPTLRWRMP
jgi:hypothetical protein